MQIKDATKLRERWTKKGSSLCEHRNLEKEFNMETATGNYACTTCGESGAGNEWQKKQRSAESLAK